MVVEPSALDVLLRLGVRAAPVEPALLVGVGRKARSAIAVGTTAERTTVTSSENCVRSMIPAFRP
jgi:hypothetical protein